MLLFSSWLPYGVLLLHLIINCYSKLTTCLPKAREAGGFKKGSHLSWLWWFKLLHVEQSDAPRTAGKAMTLKNEPPCDVKNLCNAFLTPCSDITRSSEDTALRNLCYMEVEHVPFLLEIWALNKRLGNFPGCLGGIFSGWRAGGNDKPVHCNHLRKKDVWHSYVVC